jgi:uncharacterized protein
MGFQLPNEVQKYLNKSRKELQSADLLLQNNFWDDTISRAYYAVFHAIVAVLRFKKIILSVHKHTVILNQFKANLIDTKEIDAGILLKIQKIKISRENADYNVNEAKTKEEAEKIIAEAKEICRIIEKFLHSV